MRWILWVLLTSFYSCEQHRISDINHTVQVDGLLKEADVRRIHKDVDGARAFLDSAYAQFPEVGIRDRYRKYTYLLGHYVSRGNHKISEDNHNVDRYLDSLTALFNRDETKVRYQKEFALLHLYRGDRLQYLKNYDEAYSYYFRGKLLMDPIDKCQKSQYTSRMAGMNFENKNYAKAASFYKQTYQETQQCTKERNFDEQFVNRQGCLSNIGLCYQKLEKLDSAVYFYHQALQFIQQNEHRFPEQKEFMAMARGVIYGNLGTAYWKKKEYKQAIPVLKESVRINSRKNYYNLDAQFSQAALCGAYVDDKQLDKAYKELQSLKISLDTLPNEEARLRWYDVEWQYWEKVHQPGRSQQYLKKYLNLKEIVEGNARTFEGMDLALQKLDSDHKIELLRKKEELNRLYLLGVITFLGMALLIWLGWKRDRRNLSKLAVLNQKIIGRNTQLQATMTVLETSLKENYRLLKVVAHDLRTPVGAIHMAVGLLLEGELKMRTPRYFLDMIKTSSENALDLIDNLLQSNTVLEKKERAELGAFLMSCVDVMQLKAEAKKQSIVLKTSAIEVIIDKQKMWRVIANLITNAIKFSPPESTITVRTKLQSDTVQLTIEDQGIGIPAQLKDSVFEPFTQAKRTGTSGEKAFGLGLSISRQIVEAHQGKLWFESKENQGTTFFVELPVTNLEET